MAQTDLKSDDFCGYNQASAPLEWTLQKGQYNNTFSIGTVGVNAASNYVRPDIVNIDSFLSGRDDILSRCNPPIPSMDDANEAPLVYQNQKNTNMLQSIYSREKKSAVNLSAVTYIPLTFQAELFTPAQDLNHIIFAGQAERGGIETRNLIKSSYNSNMCENFISPQRACGKECSLTNGYMTRLPYSAAHPEAEWGKLPQGLSSESWANPSATNTQIGMARPPQRITSQQVISAGASAMGNQQVVPTMLASPNDPRNDFMSVNPIPTRSNPYNPPPSLKDPLTGQYYNVSKFEPLVAQ
jgi:hypothetical protein